MAVSVGGLYHQNEVAHGDTGRDVVTGLVVRDAHLNKHLVPLYLSSSGHRDRVLQQRLVLRPWHLVVVDAIGISTQPAFLGEDEIVVVNRGHVTVLAGLASFWIAIGTFQPFTEGVIDHDAPGDFVLARDAVEDAVVTGGAKGTLLL